VAASMATAVVALAYPPIWSIADDTLVLRQAGERGLAALVWAYSGYLIVAQRAVSLIQTPDPLLIGALGSYAAVFLVALFLAWRVHPAAAIALILAPGYGVYGTLSDIQWVLAVYLLGMLVATPPTSVRGLLGDVIGVFACGLTGPFSIFLLPLYGVRALNPIWHRHLLVLASTAAIQIVSLALTPRHHPPSHDFLLVLAVRDVVPVVLIMFVGWWFSIRRTLGALYVAIVIPTLGVLGTLHTSSELLAGNGQGYFYGTRYFYLPWIVALAMVLILLASRLGAHSPLLRR